MNEWEVLLPGLLHFHRALITGVHRACRGKSPDRDDFDRRLDAERIRTNSKGL
ncbi:hypothetical protein [Hyalangium minutum]|uniref:Uncharacterized protein n=1 Tax=Hyalangium minutum TaxID=394096 RepID=A0A085WEY3_9BACT|nr:hypothetical protein [Hyalangium minutum]KFE66246.1 hypothetical protein DB31_1311 [Hyalangium minutum]